MHINVTPLTYLASLSSETLSVFFLKPGLLLSSFLVVCVVREVVEVVFDGHEEAREPSAAAQLGGEDDARDLVVRGRVG